VPSLVADENFDARIVSGPLRRLPRLDIVRVIDVGLAETPDPALLAWAATQERVLLTHDRDTLIGYANERVARGLPMSGVIDVTKRCPVGRAIEDLVILLECTADDEWAGRVYYIPM